jgi:hypothetical protein
MLRFERSIPELKRTRCQNIMLDFRPGLTDKGREQTAKAAGYVRKLVEDA